MCSENKHIKTIKRKIKKESKDICLKENHIKRSNLNRFDLGEQLNHSWI